MYKHVKHVMDFVLALIGLIILSPVFLVVAIVIKLDSEGPIFYSQDRGGYHNIPFKIYKFRTMVRDADRLGGAITGLNDARVTRVGNVLRKTKLDEIPQLINILKGEMSFVGPRPEHPMYISKYNEEEKHILDVRPGITDMSSIRFVNLDEVVGEDNAAENYEKYVFKKKNRLRLEYVEKQSFLLDSKLFFLTVLVVFKKAFKFMFRRSYAPVTPITINTEPVSTELFESAGN